MGKGKELAVYGYDSDNKVYTRAAFDSWGEAEKSTGTVNGDTWVWTQRRAHGRTDHEGPLHYESAVADVVHLEVRAVSGWGELDDGGGRHGNEEVG